MKKKNKKVMTSFPLWLMAFLVIVTSLLIVLGKKSVDTRSSASESVEAGVVLPVASDRE